ncbi:class I adenylate-forming enzyme family protein [Erythrobacter litoralis]|uniref:Putative long-chain fatty-acid-CoA ligase n=1 Tax=Erythrobacter litoralis (strain HTCC2594) TaxID=314225 RepID=Q2NDR0_ERYLH|nr:AMP-binding protein [Erythrobacter litoralis]ABC62181.1 putative long-chain fatty-acid-CoA ligase [Erythrobacter litoralis HTCC2594]
MYELDLSEAYCPAQADTPYEERTIEDVLRAQAAERPDALALRELLADGNAGRQWTYAELLVDAERAGRALASRHPAGTRIAIMGGNCPEWVLIQLGAAMAGLVLVTVNPSFLPREVRYVLEQSGAGAVYYQPNVRGSALRPVVDEAAAGLAASDYVIDIEDHGDLFAGENDGELRATEPRDICMIQYTSGTTGFPKGVLLHQHGLIQSNQDLFRRWNITEGKLVMCPFPLFHTAGSAVNVLGCLSQGACLLLVSLFDPVAVAKAIEREKPDVLGGVATMLYAILEAAKATGTDVFSVSTVLSGGAMVPPELNRAAQASFGVPILIVYGQTETSPAITAAWPTDTGAELVETIGQPCSHMEVAILDPATRSVCAVDEQGEICMRGFNQMVGYNDNPQATAETIDEDGWLHTGDLGRMSARGYVRITGRVKEMIIRGGENLFPAEIEAAMIEHPAIAEVAVAGVADEKWGEIVACFMRLAEGHERPGDDDLKTFVRERLSPQKTPAHWIWVTEFPLTGSGKIQKFALAEAFEKGEFAAQAA